MDTQTGRFKKKRRKRQRNPPPPLFTSDRPTFGSRNQMSNRSPIFPRRSGSPPGLPMNSDEMFDRFNQLLDWDLPNQRNSPDNFNEYDRKGHKIEQPQQSSYFTRSPDDLRNRLDQQSKRWKMQENLRTYKPNAFEEDWMNNPSRERADTVNVNSQRDFNDCRFKLDFMEEQRRFKEEELDDDDARFVDMHRRRDIRDDQWQGSDRDCGLLKNDRQDFGREIKEFWPERNMAETEFSRNDGRYVSFFREKEYLDDENKTFENNRDNYNKFLYNRDFPHHNRHYDDDRVIEENFDSRRRVCEPSPIGINSEDRFLNFDLNRDGHYSNYNQQNVSSNVRERYFIENMPSTSIYRNPGSSPKETGTGFSDREIKHSGENESVNPLKVIIYKATNQTFTHKEADFLRSKLIDRLEICENPDNVPEFTKSGLVRGARCYQITCRSQESMYWLLQQPLPRLNGVALFMQRQTDIGMMHISVFVARCTRTKEAAWKLLKLQNNKKGFNFDNWHLKTFQSTPNGLFMGFDVTRDEARRLKELDCKLSFELKTIKFKIANENLIK